MERERLKTGSLKGGHAGTKVHPDSPHEQEKNRVKAMQRALGTEEVEHDWAVVERGRTVECPVPGEKKFVGFDPEGKSIYGPVLSYFGPGQKVYLPVPEIERLQKLGFLVDPNREHNSEFKSQGHPTNEPRSRVLRRSEQNTPGPVISQQ